MSSLRRNRGGTLVAGLFPTLAGAHSFGAVYVLPVPFWMYVYACVATLVLTFAMLGLLVTAPPMRVRVGWDESPRALVVGPRLLGLLRAGAVACLVVTVLAGSFGTDDPARNLGMTLFWVLFLLGFAYITAIAGDLYALINPWRTLIDLLEHWTDSAGD